MTKTKTGLLVTAAALTLALGAFQPSLSFAESNKMVGGAAMYPSRNIVENAVNSKDHTTLVAAVKQAGLVDTLSGRGPFTVFAPTNEAFDALPGGTVSGLMQPDNKSKLKTILTYHVIPGRITTEDLLVDIKKGDGKAMLKTVEGSDLTFTEMNGKIEIMDAKGGSAEITISNVEQSNGEIQVINKVLLPS
jgi:uncharacterized surface protein with fasciclin (FAS1) repeats